MSTGPTKKVRQLVIARADGMCERCGVWPVGGALHHRRPRGLGGSSLTSTNQPSNLVLLCNPCHATIESHRTMGRSNGWLVPQGYDPRTIPVLVFAVGWVWLGDDGGYARKAAA